MNIKENIKTLIIKKPLELDCGQTISDFPLAYETYGKLNENKDRLRDGIIIDVVEKIQGEGEYIATYVIMSLDINFGALAPGIKTPPINKSVSTT